MSAATAMAPDKIILKLNQVGLAYPVLRHRPEASIDAVNDLVFDEFLEEIKALINPRHGLIGEFNWLLVEEHPPAIVKGKEFIANLHHIR
jgi:hypothetical protein